MFQGWFVPINLPLTLSLAARGLPAGLLLTVCVTAVASPISAEQREDAPTKGADYGAANSGGFDTQVQKGESSRLSGLGAEVDERTETLLTYFGIEPRLVLPASQAPVRSAELEARRAENRTSVVPEPKEVMLLAVGAALLVAGGALRRWLTRRP